MKLSRRAIEKEVGRIIQDFSSEMLLRIRQRINDTIAEITAQSYWEHLKATTSFQSVAAITRGTATMTNGSKSIVYVSGSTSPSSVGRKIVLDGDNIAYLIAKVSSGTHLIANRPRDGTSVTTKALTIFQDRYQVPTVVDEIEDVVLLTDPIEDKGTLDYMTRREMDQKHPSSVEVGTPAVYCWEDDDVTSYASGTASGSANVGSMRVSSTGLVAKGVLEGMAIQVGSTLRTIKSIGTSGSGIQTYEVAPENFSTVAYSIEFRVKRIRLHPAPEKIKTFMVRYYRREFGLHRYSDFWKGEGKFHRLIIDGTAAKLLAEQGKEPARALVYQRRFDDGLTSFKRENVTSPDDTEKQMRVNDNYTDVWK